jgi:dihydrofolate reductase
MKAIIAVNNKKYIGLNNKLLWYSKDDLRHFKKLTEGQTLLVGYNTFSELPPLKNRTVIVDQRNNLLNTDWCIGGKKTYEKYCHLFTELHISIIDNDDIGDTEYPELKNLNPDCKIFTYHFSTTN